MAAVHPGLKTWNDKFPENPGTVGSIAFLTTDPGRRFMLSCAHVWGRKTGKVGDNILVSSDKKDIIVGTLIGIGSYNSNGDYSERDVAIAEINRDVAGANPSILDDIFMSGISRFHSPGLPIFVKGYADKGFKKAKISQYDQSKIIASWPEQEKFAAKGDSGAIAINRLGRACAMIQSGKKHGKPPTSLIPIHIVLRQAERLAGFGSGTLKLLTRDVPVNLDPLA